MPILQHEIEEYFWYVAYEFVNFEYIQSKYVKFEAYWTVCYSRLLLNKRQQLEFARECYKRHLKNSANLHK